MIVYFTEIGNSRYRAQMLADKLDDVMAILSKFGKMHLS